MKTVRLSVFGIPPHAALNDIPGMMLPAASLCDLFYLFGGGRSWATAGFHILQIANVGAVLAATAGALDFLRLPPDPEVRRIGRTHAMLNAVLLPLAILNQLQRRRRPDRPPLLTILLLLAANVGLGISAWHGARLVYRHGVRTGEQETPAPVAARTEPVTWRAIAE